MSYTFFALLVFTSSLWCLDTAYQPNRFSPKRLAGEFWSFFISSGDASEETHDFAQGLSKIIEPNSYVAVKKMGFLPRLFLGEKNTCNIPGLRYMLVDEEYIQSLNEEEKRFVMGRCLVSMKHHGTYSLAQALAPITASVLALGATAIKPYLSDKNVLEKCFTGAACAMYLADAFIQRNIYHDVDEKTVKIFKCFDGAQSVLQSLPQKRFISFYNIITSHLLIFKLLIKRYIPGKLDSSTTAFSSLIRSITPAKYFSSCPSSSTRIAHLKKSIRSNPLRLATRTYSCLGSIDI